MKLNFFAAAFVVLLCCLCVSSVQGQLSATDDFEVYTNNPVGKVGGSGDWTGLWGTNSQFGGGTFLSSASKIDGTKTIGLFGSGSTAGTSVSRPFPDCTNDLTIRFSMRADYNVASSAIVPANQTRLSLTIRNGNNVSHFGNQRLSFFFAAGTNNNNRFQWYDGSDRTNIAVLFVTSNVYDVAVTMSPSNRAYSFTASNRNSGASFFYSGNWTTGADGESLGSVAFFMRGPSGAGNDAFLDGVVISSTSFTPQASSPSIREGDSWRYFKGTSMPAVQGTNQWFNVGFSDAAWLGPSPSGFGYGDCDDATALGDMQNNYISVFTRRTFVVGSTSSITRLTLGVDYDDGMVAYINGIEVARRNMPGGAVNNTTAASGNHEASRSGECEFQCNCEPNEREFIPIPPSVLLNGTNVIAVSGHNVSVDSSDITLIVELYTNVTLVRGPILQMPSPGHITVTWRTDSLTDSQVDYGPDLSYGGGSVTDSNLVQSHSVELPVLPSGSTFYYRVRSGGVILKEGGTLRAPPTNAAPIGIAISGDFGGGSANSFAIANRVNSTNVDLFLTVGDNIYQDAQPGSFDPWWFQPYAATMGRSITMPALGNHDVNTSTGAWYLSNFYLPTNAPSSIRERNYSYDYGNVHFVVLDSNAFDTDNGYYTNKAADMAAIVAWLTNDLAQTDKPWKFVSYHHPPYTSQGDHSDNEEMKAAISPIMEKYGVQFALQGHNHFYERINAINGVYYLTCGGGGLSLHPLTTQRDFSAVVVNSQYTYQTINISNTVMTLRTFGQNGSMVDTFNLDIGHPFKIDGLLDSTNWIRASHGLRMNAAIRGRYLYLATQDAGEGSDHFIYLANQLSTQRPANWAKSGNIMQWGAFLGDENESGYQNWFGSNEQSLTNPAIYRSMTSGLNNNSTNANGVLEGTIDLASHFGSFPQQIYVAAAPFASAGGGYIFTNAQVPEAVVSNINIESSEFLPLFTRDIALDVPIAVAISNQAVEAGMTAALDGSGSSAPSGFPLTFAWSQDTGPAGVFTAPSNTLTSFYVTNNVAASTGVVLRLTVNDTRFDSTGQVVVTVDPMLDSDNDGLSDKEETTGLDNVLTFANPDGHITNPFNRDSDNDGSIDGDEAVAGTDPNDLFSVFELLSSNMGTTTGIVLHWSSVDGKLYSILRFTNLPSDSMPVATNIAATPAMNSYTTPLDNAGHTFFSIEVEH